MAGIKEQIERLKQAGLIDERESKVKPMRAYRIRMKNRRLLIMVWDDGSCDFLAARLFGGWRKVDGIENRDRVLRHTIRFGPLALHGVSRALNEEWAFLADHAERQVEADGRKAEGVRLTLKEDVSNG